LALSSTNKSAIQKQHKNTSIHQDAVEDHEYPDVLFLNHGIKGVDNTAALSDNFEKIKLQSHTKLVNLIKTVAVEASKNSDRYLLLTSSASRQHRLYHGYLEKYAVSFAETTPNQQKILDQAIELIMAHKLSDAGKTIQKVLNIAKKDGFTAVIAACTELPIAIDNCRDSLGLRIIDSNDILSKELLKSYYGQLVSV